MNAINRLDRLLSDVFKPTAAERVRTMNSDTRPTAAPLPPRRDASSFKLHRRRYRIDSSDKPQSDAPLLNSSTLDDLFRALTLECEQCLAATTSYHNKTYGQMIAPTTESNDDDYENLQPPAKANGTPLRTSIEVVSPTKRHVVSITVSSKVTAAVPSPIVSPTRPPPPTPTTPTVPLAFCRSSEEEPANSTPLSANGRKRRRRTRKQLVSTSAIRSSSSSTERPAKAIERRSFSSKRSSSTDPRHHRLKTPQDSHLSAALSAHKPCTKRPHRRDVSLQHTGRYQENHRSPLSVLLTSTKPTSDFLTGSQQRRSRLESVDHKPLPPPPPPSSLFYRPSSARNNNHQHHSGKSKNNNNSNIPSHRLPPYPVY